MAAIYAYLPSGELYLTSQPYPIYQIDSVSEDLDLESAYGVYWIPENVIDTVEVLSGNIFQTVWYRYYTAEPETLDSDVNLLSATLIETVGYVEVPAPMEATLPAVELLTATLVEVIQYITIEQPADNVSEDFDIVSGYSLPA